VGLLHSKLALAIGLASALVLVVVGFAVFRGLGAPSVPDGDIAIVEGVDPEGVSEAEFDVAFDLLLARQGTTDQPPQEGSDEFQATRDAAVNDVLLERWLLGAAEEQGFNISDREVDQRLEEIKERSFSSEQEFERFVEESGFTDEDVLSRVRIQVINERLQESLVNDIPEVSDAEVLAFYEQNTDQFSRPESRQVRLILNADEAVVAEARAELEADDSGRTWRRLAEEFSTDEISKNRGGRLDGVVDGLGDPDFDRTVFESQEGELVGPFETASGFYLIQVVGSTPADETSLDEVSENIRRQISGTRQQLDAALFQNLFLQKWATRTTCAEDFITSQCNNAPPFPRPPDTPPVLSSVPAAPGTGGEIGAPVPQLPQTPYPSQLREGPQGVAPGLPGALPTP